MTGIPVVQRQQQLLDGFDRPFLARQAIESGAADCVLALGFEQMNPGALGTVFNDRPSPFEDFDREAEALVGMPELPLALRYFGGAGLAHMSATARRCKRSPKCAPRRAGTQRATRSRCCARSSRSTT